MAQAIVVFDYANILVFSVFGKIQILNIIMYFNVVYGEERRGKAHKKLHEMKKRLIIIYTKRIFEKHWIHLQASMFYP